MKVMNSLTASFLLIKLIIILFYRSIKMSRYSKWQQQTKSQDIGILTLFHLQEMHGQNDSRITIDYDRSVELQAPSVVKRIKKKEHKWLSELESGLCNKIGTYGCQAQMAKQLKGRHQKNGWIYSQPRQQKMHKLRMERMSRIEAGQKNRKISLKLQYYDVAHMSMVLNSRPIKNKLYSKPKTLNEERDKQTENIQRRQKPLGNSKNELQAKTNKKESYRQVYTKSLKELLTSSHQNSLSAKKISHQTTNPDNQGVINLDGIKLRRQKYDFREIFKKKFKISSERGFLRVPKEHANRQKTHDWKDRQKRPRFLKPLKNVNLMCASSKLLEQISKNQLLIHLSMDSSVQKQGVFPL